MIPDTNDIVNDSVPDKKNTSFICGVIEGSLIADFKMYILRRSEISSLVWKFFVFLYPIYLGEWDSILLCMLCWFCCHYSM